LRGADELAPPPMNAPEVLFESGSHQLAGDLPVAAEVGEVQLVEDDRGHGRQLLTLEGTDLGGD
jgi:hypothetical protein